VVDSSDVEVEEVIPDKFARAGAQSVSAMRENAATLRLESKKASKQLQAVTGAPGTRYQRARWGNAWKSFFEDVLLKEHVHI